MLIFNYQDTEARRLSLCGIFSTQTHHFLSGTVSHLQIAELLTHIGIINTNKKAKCVLDEHTIVSCISFDCEEERPYYLMCLYTSRYMKIASGENEKEFICSRMHLCADELIWSGRMQLESYVLKTLPAFCTVKACLSTWSTTISDKFTAVVTTKTVILIQTMQEFNQNHK